MFEKCKTTEGISEQIKADNQMEWVCKITNMRDWAMEFVDEELYLNWIIWATERTKTFCRLFSFFSDANWLHPIANLFKGIPSVC